MRSSSSTSSAARDMASAKPKKLKLTRVLPGIAGNFPGWDEGIAVATPPPGKHIIARLSDAGTLVLTSEGLFLLGDKQARVDAHHAKQLVATGDVAVTMAES